MIVQAYTIYDRKALQYHAPFFAVAVGAALRTVMDLANDLQTTIGRHPADYVLFRCGSYDDATGLFEPCVLEHVADILTLVHVAPEPPLFRTDAAGTTYTPTKANAK